MGIEGHSALPDVDTLLVNSWDLHSIWRFQDIHLSYSMQTPLFYKDITQISVFILCGQIMLCCSTQPDKMTFTEEGTTEERREERASPFGMKLFTNPFLFQAKLPCSVLHAAIINLWLLLYSPFSHCANNVSILPLQTKEVSESLRSPTASTNCKHIYS